MMNDAVMLSNFKQKKVEGKRTPRREIASKDKDQI